MSETLPSQQNESQAWKRELPLHHELGGTLKPEETLALIGSFTESSLEAYKEANETDELNGQSFSVKQRIHTAALEQLTTLKVEEDVNVFDTIADRQKELEEILRSPNGGTRSRAETQKLREQLDGVKLLNKMYLNVDDTVDTFAQTHGDGNKFNRHNRTAAINEMVAQHNEQVSRGSETITDSPEIREAQERINARYAEQAEQAKQPQPTEIVDDARQKVAETFGDTGEKERQTLIGEVARAAKGATRINTDIPSLYEGLQSNQGAYTEPNGGGFTTFGDGLPPDSWQYKGQILQYAGAAEAFMSKPDTEVRYKTEMVDEQEFGRFRRVKTVKKERQVPDGEIPIMVLNSETGQQDVGIKVAYQFNGGKRGREGAPDRADYEGPAYLTKSGRTGNQMIVEATLPKSIADKLKAEVAKNPTLAREFAKTLTINNGISEEFWNSVVRPPYSELPSDWEIAVANQ